MHNNISRQRRQHVIRTRSGLHLPWHGRADPGNLRLHIRGKQGPSVVVGGVPVRGCLREVFADGVRHELYGGVEFGVGFYLQQMR